jgi:hypothetical protein
MLQDEAVCLDSQMRGKAARNELTGACRIIHHLQWLYLRSKYFLTAMHLLPSCYFALHDSLRSSGPSWQSIKNCEKAKRVEAPFSQFFLAGKQQSVYTVLRRVTACKIATRIQAPIRATSRLPQKPKVASGTSRPTMNPPTKAPTRPRIRSPKMPYPLPGMITPASQPATRPITIHPIIPPGFNAAPRTILIILSPLNT